MQARSENLVKMANQIATFFESQSEDRPDVAAQAVAGHLKLFWAPEMRALLLEELDHPTGGDMLPVVTQALRTHAAKLMAPGAHIKGEASQVFPQGGGDAG